MLKNNYYFRNIYSDNNIDVNIHHKSIVFDLKCQNNVMISSWHNGGYHENMKHILNQTVECEDYKIIDTMDFCDYQKLVMEDLGLDSSRSAGLITSACMDNYAIETVIYRDVKVVAVVTAGADKNGIKAGDSASFYEYDHSYENVGTINIILFIDANLEAGTLINAIITATEAKSSTLMDLKLESQYSENIATGTGTDGICVISNKSSDNHLENAGKHSKLGEVIAKAVRTATFKALYLQTAMSPDYQANVLSRLSRFNVDFDVLYDAYKYDVDIADYASVLYDFCDDCENIAWVSMIINLADEVENGLLSIGDVGGIIKLLTEKYMHINNECKIQQKSDIISYVVEIINEKLNKIILSKK